MDKQKTQDAAGSSELAGSLPWFIVNGGTHKVCTWPGNDAQERAEEAFRGWKLLGSPDCRSVKEANAGGEGRADPERTM